MNEIKKSAISALEALIKAISASGGDPGVVKELRRIANNEKKSNSMSGLKPEYEKKSDSLFLESYEYASLSHLEKIAESYPEKRVLDKILTERFNYSEGSVKRFTSKEKAISAIKSSIKNERAHQAISDLTKENNSR